MSDTSEREKYGVGLAEASVLGCMVQHPDTIPDVLLVVKEGDFKGDAARKLFGAVTYLYDQGRPVNVLSVCELLNDRGHLKDVPVHLVHGLAEHWSGSGGNVAYFAGLVRGDSILRDLNYAGQEITQMAQKPTGSPEEVLAEAESRIFRIAEEGAGGDTVGMNVAVSEAIDRINSRTILGDLRGVPTGFERLDRLTAGLQDSELIILAARPSVGKTALAAQVARNAAAAGFPVFFVSLEQSRQELAERLLCLEGGIDSFLVRAGRLDGEQASALAAANHTLRDLPVQIDDRPLQTLTRIGANARRLKRRYGTRLVVIDYLQLIRPDNPREPRQEQVASISRRLKILARELSVPVVALAQLNRAVENRGDQRPRLADLRESGAIEQDADTVMLLHRPDENDPTKSEQQIEVIVAKQRNGPIGEVPLVYEKQHLRFRDWAPKSPW